eukprot:gene14356-17323_t
MARHAASATLAATHPGAMRNSPPPYVQRPRRRAGGGGDATAAHRA